MKATSPEIPDEALHALPLFPLPGTVWFPGTPLAVHVSEPRYRALVVDCLKGSRVLAVPLLRPGFEQDYEGSPDIWPVAGAGRILGEQPLPGNRWNLLLDGISRVRLHELPRSGPYRIARAVLLEDDYPSGQMVAVRAQVATLLAAVSPMAALVRRRDARFAIGIHTRMPPGRVADLCAHRLVQEPLTRQRILEALDVRLRLALVTEAVSERLATFQTGGSPQ